MRRRRFKPAVREAMSAALELGGNASSVHGLGRKARAAVEEARERVAAMVKIKPAHVFFTGGGTEANNWAVRGWQGQVLASAIEHDSVLASVPGPYIPVTGDGIVNLEALEQMLAASAAPALVSVMLVNNETGVIQPIREVADIARRHRATVHCDAVQAAGKIPLDFYDLGVDMLSLSAHKFGGPQGVGALVLADKIPLEPLLRGGGQEKRRRAGTENVAGIVGFGTAAALVPEELARQGQLRAWRDALEEGIRNYAPDAIIAGGKAERVANTACVIMPGMKGETQVMGFDLAGLAVSSGSACSSGKVASSHVLKAMGYDIMQSGSAMRLSLGWGSRAEDVDAAIENWQKLHRRARGQAA